MRCLSFPLLLVLIAGIAPLARGQESGRPGNPEDAKLEAYFRECLDETFQARPLTATRLGEHRYDDQLDDLSEEARRGNLERDRRFLRELPERVERSALSEDGRIDYEIFRHDLERSIWLAENFDPYVNDPRVYVDFLTESVYLLLTQSSLPREKNLENALKRMEKIPRVVETARKTVGKPPRVKVETAILQTRGAINFYKEEVYLLAGVPKGEGELGERAKPLVRVAEDYLEFLEEEVLPRATDEWRIGPEKFAKKLELELDAGMSADEVLEEAEREARRVETAMVVVARQLWAELVPGEPTPPDDAEGRRELVRRVLNAIGEDHGDGESLVGDVKTTVREIKSFIEKAGILELPEPDRLRIVEMPEFMRGNSLAYLNPAPPLDPKGSSEYAVSPPPEEWTESRKESLFEEYNHEMLKILTIHEAYPGHYVQLEYSNRCPSLIRRVLGSGTFAEGWAVYTEQMMLDQGFGQGDLKLRMQQLKFYLRAVLNAILDQKMHASDMTDEQALDLLMKRGFQTEGEAVGKIIRAKQSSAQLSTYFVGRTVIYRLRQSVQRELGAKFDLGRFHEAVLAHGTLPVRYLGELVARTLGQGE